MPRRRRWTKRDTRKARAGLGRLREQIRRGSLDEAGMQMGLEAAEMPVSPSSPGTEVYGSEGRIEPMGDAYRGYRIVEGIDAAAPRRTEVVDSRGYSVGVYPTAAHARRVVDAIHGD